MLIVPHETLTKETKFACSSFVCLFVCFSHFVTQLHERDSIGLKALLNFHERKKKNVKYIRLWSLFYIFDFVSI